jgi:hypothetical protein
VDADKKLEPFLLSLIRYRLEERAFLAYFEEVFQSEFAAHAPVGIKRSERTKTLRFYSKAAKICLREFDLSQVLIRKGEGAQQFARIVIVTDRIPDVLAKSYYSYFPELNPQWASGRDFNFYMDAFAPAFSNSLEKGLRNVVKGLISSVDLQKLEEAIERTGAAAPLFEPSQGRLKFKPSKPLGSLRDRRAIAKDRTTKAKVLCERRANEHPDIKVLVDQYSEALDVLRNERGAYRLFLAGLDIETVLKVKASLPPDDDRNPKLDADLLFALSALITAHAGLIMLFPDVANFTRELDQYRQQSESIDALRDRVLDPVLEQLSVSKEMFDAGTAHLTQLVNDLGGRETAARLLPSKSVVAVKHAWLRGALAGIGRFILHKGAEFAKATRDGIVGGIAFEAVKENLVLAITSFLIATQTQLVRLADALPSTFGWIRHMLGLLVSVPEHLESYESFVIQEGWPDSRRVTRCGQQKTVRATTAADCATRAI